MLLGVSLGKASWLNLDKSHQAYIIAGDKHSSFLFRIVNNAQ
jgi:hypothetical protein